MQKYSIKTSGLTKLPPPEKISARSLIQLSMRYAAGMGETVLRRMSAKIKTTFKNKTSGSPLKIPAQKAEGV